MNDYAVNVKNAFKIYDSKIVKSLKPILEGFYMKVPRNVV